VASEPGGTTRRALRTLFEVGTLTGLTDGQLLERFATGPGEGAERAFEALVERHGSMVLRACRGILRDDHDAMDAFQATFLVLARKGGTLWVRDSLGPWLHRVACRAAARARDGATRRRSAEIRLAGLSAAEAGPDDRDRDRHEIAAILHEEVDRLPERYRAPIVLCDLEGQTSEEAARHLGCPVGTVGSRLSRGRARLRGRLVRRGLAPAVVGLLSREAIGAVVPEALARLAVRSGMPFAARQAAAGASSAAVVRLAEDVSRSLLMSKLQSGVVALVACCGLTTVAGVSIRAVIAGPQDSPRAEPAPQVKAEAVAKPKDDDPLDQRGRQKDALLRMIGNMLPMTPYGAGERTTSRDAVLFRDGTAKLWNFESKDPICPPLRHRGPIWDMSFLDDARLLITTSEDSVKVWDAVTGRLRKEMDGQVIRPLHHSRYESGRFATVDVGGHIVTIWDAKTLEPVAKVRPDVYPKLVGAGLSKDGRTLATLGADRSVTLRDAATGKPFATLMDPSPAIAGVFIDDETWTYRLVFQLDEPFWERVKSLLPPVDKPAGK